MPVHNLARYTVVRRVRTYIFMRFRLVWVLEILSVYLTRVDMNHGTHTALLQTGVNWKQQWSCTSFTQFITLIAFRKRTRLQLTLFLRHNCFKHFDVYVIFWLRQQWKINRRLLFLGHILNNFIESSILRLIDQLVFYFLWISSNLTLIFWRLLLYLIVIQRTT